MTDDTPTAETADGVLHQRVLDPPALKALAHPLRFQLVELLVEHGPSTASGLGRLVGESSGSTSYHLRQLAEHGLIEEAEDLGSRRDRYWRVARGGWTLEGFDLLERDDTRDDAQMVLDEVLRARMQRLRRWHRDAGAWGDEWVHSTIEMTSRLRLTRDELEELRDDLVAVIDRWRDRLGSRRDDGTEPADVVPVTVHLDTFPTGDPPAAGGPDAEPVQGPA
ncbi:MAG: helix-turn-helix domain-containing protein [Actinobacteria bacterium]|nr:helix-turn-helix domain-containing protein [Actinomycetota bacterium]